MDSNFATRLKHFFEYANLTSSQFADTCGIARPTLSQILTGRNKKISDVLISQIHQAYPDLSILWLLFGEGEMKNSSNRSFGDREENNKENFPDSNTDRGADAEYDEEFGVKSRQNYPNIPNSQEVNSNCDFSSQRVTIIPSPQVIRKIDHITVYYDDSTFETFYPRHEKSK